MTRRKRCEQRDPSRFGEYSPGSDERQASDKAASDIASIKAALGRYYLDNGPCLRISRNNRRSHGLGRFNPTPEDLGSGACT